MLVKEMISEEVEKIIEWIREYVKSSGAKGIVVRK